MVQPSILNGFSSPGLSSRKTFVVAVLVGGIAFVAISAGAREVRISADARNTTDNAENIEGAKTR